MRYKQTDEHKLSYFSSKVIFKTILRMENIGQIYHKHKIRGVLNCDMIKALKKTSKLVLFLLVLILILNLKFQMKL